jgi:hypothetical protein
MKKVLGFLILIFALMALATPASAQIFDTPCPAGTSVLANGQTVNPANGHLKAYLCVDLLGNVSSPSFGLTANSPGIPSFNGKNIYFASNYGVKAGGFKFCDANVAASSSGVVTIGNDANLNDPSLLTIGVQPGWIAWVSTYICSGYNTAYGILIPVGVVSSVQSATQLTLSTTSSGPCNGTLGGQTNKCTLYLFPQDDTTAIGNWIQAVSAPGACGIGVMWSGLALVSSSTATQFQAGCAADNTGNGSWPGVTIVGAAQNASVAGSVMVINPSMSVSTCPSSVCTFHMPASASVQNDIHVANFSEDGGGNAQPTGFATASAAISLGADSTLYDVGVFAWGICQGLTSNGSNNAPVIVRGFFAAGVGNNQGGTCAEEVANQSTITTHSNIFWCQVVCIQSTNGNNLGSNIWAFNQIGVSTNDPVFTVSSGSQAYFDHNYWNEEAGSNNMDTLQCNGTCWIDGDNFANSASANGLRGLHVSSTGTAYVQNAQFPLSTLTGVGVLIDSGGKYFDGGGNVNTSVTPYTVNGSFIGQNSTTTFNTTLVTAAKLVLSAGWGSTAADTALSGGNSPIEFTITNSGTGQAASPTITYTFPTPYAVAPFTCAATQIGGTNPVNTFTASALSKTGVTFTSNLTPTASDTEIVQITCVSP